MEDQNTILTPQLHQLVQSMESQGYLDGYFEKAGMLGEDQSSSLIPNFCINMQDIFRAMTANLDQPIVDFHTLFVDLMRLKGSTSCFGASRLSLASNTLQAAVLDESKQGCLTAIQELKQEYFNLHEKLDAIHKLERRIASLESTVEDVSQL